MSLEFDFKIEGAKELDKVLASLPKAVGKAQLKSALRRSAKPIVKEARTRAPKDTGAMAKSIKVRTMTRTRVPAAISIGPDAEHFYGRFPEFGTSKIKATPFLRPAWDTNKRTVVKTFTADLWYVLVRTAKRYKKQAYAGKLSNPARKALGL